MMTREDQPDGRPGTRAPETAGGKRGAAHACDTGGRPLHILIVEDEMLPAMLLEETMRRAGHTTRKAARLSRAVALARAESFDAAVLDVNLAGEPVFPLAAMLREQGVPFLFATGYGEAGLPPEYRDCDVLQKPYTTEMFNRALAALLAAR